MASITGTKFGKCRCCSAEGYHRDLNKEYCWNGIREVYSDMFLECFNLHLSPKPKLTTLICNPCVSRLRDASSFRFLVASTEQQLLDSLEPGYCEDVVVNIKCDDKIPENIVKVESSAEVKVEPWVPESHSDDWFDDNEETFEEQLSDPSCKLVEGESALLERFASAAAPALPTREKLRVICKDFVRHLEALEGKRIIAKKLENILNPRKLRTRIAKERPDDKDSSDAPLKKRIQRTKLYKDKKIDIEYERNPYAVERFTHATNISALLEFSNVTAFKSKFQRAYPCFYCAKLFEDFEELKSHQKIDHVNENINKCVLQKYRVGRPDALVVYADVSDLECKICNKNIPSLKDLKVHLTETHQKKMYLELTDRVIPFKVIENNFQCQVCGNLYETFGSVEKHMNNHYRNYVCEECDAGFITKHRLKIHGYLMHSKSTKKYTCEVCQKQFTSQQKRKIHVETVHENVKKYKCNRCPERFNEYFRRHKHMVVVHGVAPIEYKCNVCEKTFDRRYALSIHMRTHIQQKDVMCEVCPYRCFTKVELRHHMIKHNGERIHECAVCKKSYAREKTLKEHMRIHTNDRRFVCPVCGQGFIQNCSLKSHIRSHHKDYELM